MFKVVRLDGIVLIIPKTIVDEIRSLPESRLSQREITVYVSCLSLFPKFSLVIKYLKMSRTLMAKVPRQMFYLVVIFMRECYEIDLLRIFSVLQQAPSRRLSTHLIKNLLSTKVIIRNNNFSDHNDKQIFNRSMDAHDNKSKFNSSHCRCLNSSHIRNFTLSKSTLDINVCSLHRKYIRHNVYFTFISTCFSQIYFKPPAFVLAHSFLSSPG